MVAEDASAESTEEVETKAKGKKRKPVKAAGPAKKKAKVEETVDREAQQPKDDDEEHTGQFTLNKLSSLLQLACS